MSNNSALFTTVLDMLAALIHSTLITDRDQSNSERSEESRNKHHNYHNLVKKLKKEIGECHNVTIKYLKQLLPFPKTFLEVIISEPFGTVSDGKGNKKKGFNCDKKLGLQVSDKQKINPWEILEGHRNPAPLSWAWFGAVKTERKPMKYEESFMESKYTSVDLEHPTSYYLESPPLPAEDLEPQPKEAKQQEEQRPGQTGMMNANAPVGVGGPLQQGGMMMPFGGQGGGPQPGQPGRELKLKLCCCWIAQS